MCARTRSTATRPTDLKRRAYRTVLDTLFHALVRYAAPVLCFTAEEVWQARYPSEDGSVHLLEWPELPAMPGDAPLGTRWQEVRALRVQVTEAIEPLRREKTVRSSLEAEVVVPALPLPAERAGRGVHRRRRDGGRRDRGRRGPST